MSYYQLQEGTISGFILLSILLLLTAPGRNILITILTVVITGIFAAIIAPFVGALYFLVYICGGDMDAIKRNARKND